MAEVEAKAYQDELEKEIERDRIAHGKSPLPPENDKKKREIKVSKTDPDSGMFVKNERERVFAYSYHTACDRHGWILHTYVTAANVHDSQAFFELFERVKQEIKGCPTDVCIDAGYKTPAIAKYLLEQEIHPIWPYTRQRRKMGSSENLNLHMTNILTVTFVQITKCYLIQQRIGKAIGV
ncbi:MAG: transposase [Anoxybacillus sp.]|nr:MAG: transposase [Anoxybacillus sp.]